MSIRYSAGQCRHAHHEGSDMDLLRTVLAIAAFAVIAGVGQAAAAPPTVTPSPGYDARLQEQHKAISATTPGQAVTSPGTTAPRHHTRRKRKH
jgi:hypothetical protein